MTAVPVLTKNVCSFVILRSPTSWRHVRGPSKSLSWARDETRPWGFKVTALWFNLWEIHGELYTIFSSVQRQMGTTLASNQSLAAASQNKLLMAFLLWAQVLALAAFLSPLCELLFCTAGIWTCKPRNNTSLKGFNSLKNGLSLLRTCNLHFLEVINVGFSSFHGVIPLAHLN